MIHDHHRIHRRGGIKRGFAVLSLSVIAATAILWGAGANQAIGLPQAVAAVVAYVAMLGLARAILSPRHRQQ